MANLWRTQRPRFPNYQSDGLGRDFYIKYVNGGFWDGQFIISKKPDYERPRYRNFHSLNHFPAPFKYWGDGSGRENYILKCNGFIHDEKPLCSYHLTDFLRNNKTIKGIPENYRKKVYFSVSEMKYNKKLKNIENKLIKRLYTEPMKKRKKKIQIIAEDNKDAVNNMELLRTCPNNNRINVTATNEEIPPKHMLTETSYDKYNMKNRGYPMQNNWSLDAGTSKNYCRNKISLKLNSDGKKNITYFNNFYNSRANNNSNMGTGHFNTENNKSTDTTEKFYKTLNAKSPNNKKILMKKIKIIN
jgi:hypothetical protein